MARLTRLQINTIRRRRLRWHLELQKFTARYPLVCLLILLSWDYLRHNIVLLPLGVFSWYLFICGAIWLGEELADVRHPEKPEVDFFILEDDFLAATPGISIAGLVFRLICMSIATILIAEQITH